MASTSERFAKLIRVGPVEIDSFAGYYMYTKTEERPDGMGRRIWNKLKIRAWDQKTRIPEGPDFQWGYH